MDYHAQNVQPRELLLFQQRRMMTVLFKVFLVELEEMRGDGLISEDYFLKKRKEILDLGNNLIREYEELVGKFNVDYKI